MDRLTESESRLIARELIDSFAKRLAWIAETNSGTLTVNALRVRAAITSAVLGGELVTSSDIARSLGLNNTTVHRIITTMIEDGQIKESDDPDDGRKRILGFTEQQWDQFSGNVNEWISLTLEGLGRDTEVLKRHDLMPASTQETVAELVLQIKRDGSLSVSGFDLPPGMVLDK